MLQTPSMSLDEDLAQSFFCLFFAWNKIMREIWTSLDQIYSVEKIKETPPGGRVSGCTRRTCVQNFSVYISWKRRGHLDLRAENMCILRSYL